MNKNSIIGFISHTINGMYKNGRKSSKKIINKNPTEKPQLKLSTIGNLMKIGEI